MFYQEACRLFTQVKLRYEFFYDVVLDGRYTFHLRKLHQEYGPIIRINPYELHVSDPSFYDALYASATRGEKRNKWNFFVRQFGTTDSIFATIDHDMHRMRRAPLNRFFSTASVRRLQPVIDERAQQLVERLRNAKHTSNDFFCANDVFAAYANGTYLQDLR